MKHIYRKQSHYYLFWVFLLALVAQIGATSQVLAEEALDPPALYATWVKDPNHIDYNYLAFGGGKFLE